MWSQTVGLKLGQDRSETKKFGLGLARCGLGLGLSLAGLVLFCKTRSCHVRRHNDIEGHSNFSSIIYSFSGCGSKMEDVQCYIRGTRPLSENMRS